MSEQYEVALLLRWCDLTLEGLADAREDIDALNVYPVPDGDTGTNLFLTFEAARQAILDSDSSSLVSALRVFARGALLGARGNSGVILSQLLRAGADQLLRGDPTKPGQLLADTLTRAAEAAYAAVAKPVEGTMLTVAREAARAASSAVPFAPADLGAQMGHVATAAAIAARAALEETREQLEPLRLAGVVDAGGMGLCVLFDAGQHALTGVRPDPGPEALRPSAGEWDAVTGARASSAGPHYEVMYLLDAPEEKISSLKQRLGPLGDSLVVVGGENLWNIHVHVDDAGAAIEAGIQAGRPYRVRVTSLGDQMSQSARDHTCVEQSGVVAVAAGPGLAELFEAAGAVVVTHGPGRRCSAAELLSAMRTVPSRQVVVLPNDSSTLTVAEAAASAARAEGFRVAVIPARAQVQGLAAIAVHDDSRSFDDDVVQMTSAAGHARHGGVTIATREALTTAGPCHEGDALGVIDGDFVLVGEDLAAVAVDVVERLLQSGGEMLTLVRGAGAPDDLVRRVGSHVSTAHAGIEVLVYDGGQDRYPLLVGVE
ncbi:MAG: DAK2 domain-containing protein [Nocardioidaceae bacterium]|nr:DAK2 domain-containing protein [Nocardioidaceae bacterium]